MKIIALLLCLSLPVYPWGDVGHEIVAEIAWRGLDKKIQTKAQNLLDVMAPFYPGTKSFLVAARWADDVKYGLHAFDAWHYITLDVAQKKPKIPKGPHVLFGLCEAANTLKGKSADKRAKHTKDFEKSMMLRMFLHLMADVHQPLHTSSLFNTTFKKGDLGGNKYLILLDNQPVKLHLYWDLGLGLLGDPLKSYKSTQKASKKTKPLADLIIKEFPKSAFQKESIENTDLKALVLESFELSKSVRDTPQNQTPSQAYIQKNQTLIKKRLALAGYRLGYWLNELLKEPSVLEIKGCQKAFKKKKTG